MRKITLSLAPWASGAGAFTADDNALNASKLPTTSALRNGKVLAGTVGAGAREASPAQALLTPLARQEARTVLKSEGMETC